MRQYLTAREFAHVVKRDPKTVINWIKRGWIVGTRRIGHLYQIPASEINVYQNSKNYPAKKWRKS